MVSTAVMAHCPAKTYFMRMRTRAHTRIYLIERAIYRYRENISIAAAQPFTICRSSRCIDLDNLRPTDSYYRI